MKKPDYSGNFFVAVIINLIFNLEWSLPAWILLGLHFWLKISILWFIIALALWVVGVVVKTIILSYLCKVGNIPDPPKENKNPYSSKYRK